MRRSVHLTEALGGTCNSPSIYGKNPYNFCLIKVDERKTIAPEKNPKWHKISDSTSNYTR